jgi:signal peptidase I
MEGDRPRGGAYDGDDSDTETFHAYVPEEHRSGARPGGWSESGGDEWPGGASGSASYSAGFSSASPGFSPGAMGHEGDGWVGQVRRTPGAHFRPEDVPGPPPGYRLASPDTTAWSGGSSWSAFGPPPTRTDGANGHDHADPQDGRDTGGHDAGRHDASRHDAGRHGARGGLYGGGLNGGPHGDGSPGGGLPGGGLPGGGLHGGGLHGGGANGFANGAEAAPPAGAAPFAHSTSAGSPYHSTQSPFDPRRDDGSWYVNRPERPGSLRSAVRQGQSVAPPRRVGLAGQLATRAGDLATRAGQLARPGPRPGPRGARRATRGYGAAPPPGRGAGGAAAASTDGDARRHVMPLWQELPLLLVVCFCMAVLVRTFLLQAFFIPSSSMEATLLVGDRVVVNKIVYDVRTPERGEIVVFRGTANWAPENPAPPASGLIGRIGRTLGDLVGVSRPGEKDFIKRVIGLPGDRVSCCDPAGRIYVNGQGIDEPYINVNSALDVPPTPGTCGSRRFAEVLVPPGQLFVMGDNRIVSQDSRCQGPVPIENVIGRAFAIVWPSGRWGSLGVPNAFDSVPDPVALGPPGNQAPGGTPAGAVVGGALFLPILASLAVTARTARKRRWGRRRLPW